MLRRLSQSLDVIYRTAGYAAGVLLVLMCCMILYSILARALGLYLGGVTDMAGYVMATSTFLGLAYTFRSNGHIRVVLLVQRLTGPTRRGVEIVVHVIMAIVVIFFAFYLARLTYFSYIFEERSEGADAILLWIPQTAVAIGAALFALATTHSVIQLLFDGDAMAPETTTGEGVNEV